MTRYKQEAYEQAVAFRRRGFTYTEIAKICNVSKATVSNWLRHEPFSKTVAADNQKQAVTQNTKRLASINKARVAERRHQYTAAVRSAETEYQHYRQSPLFMAGLGQYMAIGDMVDQRLIRLSSNRPELHQLFIRFVTTYLGVPKPTIRFWLLLYPDLDEVVCMKHWCKKTSLSPAQFHKNQVIDGRSQHKTLHFGVGNTIIGSTLLKKKLVRWTELMTKELTK
ncbi:MAG: helix-turn-helix domain-containing protein [Candidatus Pacebacteria bacterium]|jgi:predicted transcriptional regulator|nr:helix-turn-helix domain-containing protein [Candidatus Paceibacterota bacterium]